MKKILPFLLMYWVCTGACIPLCTADDTVPAFSNKDLERYRSAADEGAPPTARSAALSAVEEKRHAKRARDQDAWCKKGRSAQRKVSSARDDLAVAEKDLAELWNAYPASEGKTDGSRPRGIRAAEKAADAARKKLREREDDLAALEEEAHQKDVPPGWLRCQF